MFRSSSSSRKKKIEISAPLNFEHRVHTDYDAESGNLVGLPLQWRNLINGNNAVGGRRARPKPIVDPSCITPMEIMDLKVSNS